MRKILIWLYILYMPFGYIMKKIKEFYIDYIWTDNKNLGLEEILTSFKFLSYILLFAALVISFLYFNIIWGFAFVALYYLTYIVFYKM
jgi:hypothetical protein